MQTKKPALILIQSTDSPVEMHCQKGIWERQRFSLSEYAREFQVLYYTSDQDNKQDLMPEGVIHKTAPITSRLFGLRHILYYFFLMGSAFKWRNKKLVVIRVIGVNVPAVPILKLIANQHMVISYQFDWAFGMKKDYKGVKPAVSASVQSFVVQAADHLLCTTQWLAQIAQERYNFPKNKISIIPNYVNIDVFKPEPVKKKQVAFAGRLHWSKGVDTLILAFNKFSVNRPDYKLIIMGSGEEECNLKKLIAKGANVEFKGSVSNSAVAKIFNESDIFVLPTVNMEGHPKALVEAMASGCKCITSDIPGNNNVLLECGSQDLLFQSKNADELYQRLVYASDQKNGNQYKFAIENYSSKICFEKEINILKSYVKK